MKANDFSQFRNLDPEDYYHSEEGYIIYTEKYHLKRGYCCENYCKNCPYGFGKSSSRSSKSKNSNP